MTIRVPGYTRLWLLTGVLALVPVQVSSDGLSYDEALAKNAGGQGKGQGQGESHAGDHGGASANAGAKGGGSAASAGATSASLSRYNSLRASLNRSGPGQRHACSAESRSHDSSDAKFCRVAEIPALPAVEDGAAEPVVKPAAIAPAGAPKVQAKVADVEPDIAPQPEAKVTAVDPLVVSTVKPSAVAAPEAAGSSDASLISRGDALLAMGEIIGARALYHRAYNRSDPAAARSVARTFDPVVYGNLRVMGLKPDVARALEWYRKAEAASPGSAASDIAALKAFVAEPLTPQAPPLEISANTASVEQQAALPPAQSSIAVLKQIYDRILGETTLDEQEQLAPGEEQPPEQQAAAIKQIYDWILGEEQEQLAPGEEQPHEQQAAAN